jgi:hypothetical protein
VRSHAGEIGETGGVGLIFTGSFALFGVPMLLLWFFQRPFLVVFYDGNVPEQPFDMPLTTPSIDVGPWSPPRPPEDTRRRACEGHVGWVLGCGIGPRRQMPALSEQEGKRHLREEAVTTCMQGNPPWDRPSVDCYERILLEGGDYGYQCEKYEKCTGEIDASRKARP